MAGRADAGAVVGRGVPLPARSTASNSFSLGRHAPHRLDELARKSASGRLVFADTTWSRF